MDQQKQTRAEQKYGANCTAGYIEASLRIGVHWYRWFNHDRAINNFGGNIGFYVCGFVWICGEYY